MALPSSSSPIPSGGAIATGPVGGSTKAGKPPSRPLQAFRRSSRRPEPCRSSSASRATMTPEIGDVNGRLVRKTAALLPALLLLVSRPIPADVIHLKNGGTIVADSWEARGGD